MRRTRSSRREFLWMTAAGVTSLGALRGSSGPSFEGAPVKCAVIGLGRRGREILETLTHSEGARVSAYCELYEPYRRRGARIAPEANAFEDYRRMLDEASDIEAVFVATPTHLHREPVQACLNAGKHVYCEAPLASTIEDSRAIARAGAAADRVFAAGLQNRANPLIEHTGKFLRSRAIGSPVTEEGHRYENTSWRRAVSDPDFEKSINWRLDPKVSLGLLGEWGVHIYDNSLRFQSEFPKSVTAFGSLMKWYEDGREVPDTVFSVFEYPNGYLSRFEASLANSFRQSYFLVNGSQGSILIEGPRSWWFKEADARALGWEVYATREKVGNEEGIVLRANATKLLQEGKIPSGADDSQGRLQDDPLYIALGEFLKAARQETPYPAGPEQGHQAAVMAIKAHESLAKGGKVEIDRALFEL